MTLALDTVTIRGFKSIGLLESFGLGPLNVLIGANGAGKSNFVEFLRLARAVARDELAEHLRTYGPAGAFFHRGPRRTAEIHGAFAMNGAGFAFTLGPSTTDDPRTRIEGDDRGRAAVAAWAIYQFNDTAMTASVRRGCPPGEHRRLESRAANLPAFLATLRDTEPRRYQVLEEMVRRIAPYIQELVIEEVESGAGPLVQVRWRQWEVEDTLPPGLLSDGTLRFICLASALLQPDPPATIVIDEPELGLHPEAIGVLGGLIRSASVRTQMIVATQSPLLLSEFDPAAVITVDQEKGGSRFRRIDPASLGAWLEEYSLGELWMKGMLNGQIHGP